MRRGVHVLYIHQYFATRKGVTGTRSYEFSRYLVGRGHRVTMITSGVANNEFPAAGGRRYSEYEADGIKVVSVRGGYNDVQAGSGMSGWRRMMKFYEFARVAGRVGKELPKPDVVFATHTPLTVGLAGIRIGRHFGIPFVFEVRDLWPEAIVNVGALRNPLAVWWLRRMAKKIYRRANHIVALSPGMKEGIVRSGVPAEKVTVIPNSSDLDLFKPDLDGSSARRHLGLGDKFAAIYFGAMGMANGLEYIIEAGRVLAQRGNKHIVFVLHGDGGKRIELEKAAREYGLSNPPSPAHAATAESAVVFSPLVADKAELARIVAGCDVCLTIYRAAKEQTWSPNKMFDALAAGKPVLINVGGWLGELVESNKCGRSLDPERPAALADAMEELAANPQLCRQMGENSRALAEREFDRRTLAARLEDVLIEAVGEV